MDNGQGCRGESDDQTGLGGHKVTRAWCGQHVKVDLKEKSVHWATANAVDKGIAADKSFKFKT